METTIYAVVDAHSEQAALNRASITFDRVVQRCEFPIESFSAYEFTGIGERVHGRSQQRSDAAPVSTPAGEHMLEEAWMRTESRFTENLDTIRDILKMYSEPEIMRNRDNARNSFLRVGTYVGRSVPLYSEEGWAIRSREELDSHLEMLSEPWVVPATAYRDRITR